MKLSKLAELIVLLTVMTVWRIGVASPVKTRPGGVCHLSFLSSCACLQGVNSDQPVCPVWQIVRLALCSVR